MSTSFSLCSVILNIYLKSLDLKVHKYGENQQNIRKNSN